MHPYSSHSFSGKRKLGEISNPPTYQQTISSTHVLVPMPQNHDQTKAKSQPTSPASIASTISSDSSTTPDSAAVTLSSSSYNSSPMASTQSSPARVTAIATAATATATTTTTSPVSTVTTVTITSQSPVQRQTTPRLQIPLIPQQPARSPPRVVNVYPAMSFTKCIRQGICKKHITAPQNTIIACNSCMVNRCKRCGNHLPMHKRNLTYMEQCPPGFPCGMTSVFQASPYSYIQGDKEIFNDPIGHTRGALHRPTGVSSMFEPMVPATSIELYLNWSYEKHMDTAQTVTAYEIKRVHTVYSTRRFTDFCDFAKTFTDCRAITIPIFFATSAEAAKTLIEDGFSLLNAPTKQNCIHTDFASIVKKTVQNRSVTAVEVVVLIGCGLAKNIATDPRIKADAVQSGSSIMFRSHQQTLFTHAAVVSVAPVVREFGSKDAAVILDDE